MINNTVKDHRDTASNDTEGFVLIRDKRYMCDMSYHKCDIMLHHLMSHLITAILHVTSNHETCDIRKSTLHHTAANEVFD